MLGFGDYNYEHFSPEMFHELEHARFSGPLAGESAPDFKGKTLNGDKVRLSDYRGRKNVLLVFGSVTCPMTAASITALNELYDLVGGNEIEFLFIYVREAHPGEKIPAHDSVSDKTAAAKLLREEEDIEMPILVDDLSGSIHRKYSRLPNPAFLIDRSGCVAFRSMWANPEELAAAIEELLEAQHKRGVDHVIARDGEGLSMPVSYAMLSSFRALERGGREAVSDFREAIGGVETGPEGGAFSESLLEHPGRVLAVTALTTAVLAGGLYAGFELRKRRLGVRRNPYRAYEKDEVRDAETGEDYGAVGI
ncbi:MAG TPA: redoxin domain-containing protein [Terriglobales bacterium]